MAGGPPSQFLEPRHYGYQGAAEVMPMPAEEGGTATLLIRHLPEAIPYDTLYRLFSHHGASSVRSCTSGSCIFFCSLCVRLCAGVRVFEHYTLITLAAFVYKNLVNGYVFKGKPMIIQFGRNASAVK